MQKEPSCNHCFKTRKSESNSQQRIKDSLSSISCNHCFKTRKSESNSQQSSYTF